MNSLVKSNLSQMELLHLSGQQVKSFIYLNRNYVTRKKVVPEGVQTDER